MKYSYFLVLLLTFSSSLFAQTNVFNPMGVEGSPEANSQLFELAISTDDDQERYESVASFIDTYGPWVTLSGSNIVAKIHVVSYLLQRGMDETASSLLKSNKVDGWLSYRFNDGVANDFLFALEGGNLDYLLSLFEHAPSGINTAFPVNLDGDMVTPLGILASKNMKDTEHYETILLAMLDAGAEPHKALPSGLSPMLIASSTNNMDFVRISQSFLSKQDSTLKGLLSNSPLDSSEMLEMQAIADALIERGIANEDDYDPEKLHTLWIQMIIKGYNVPADLIYDMLKESAGFSVDYRFDGGLNGLMASTLSNLYGGNVEYAEKLIERGADPSQLIDVSEGEQDVRINLIQLALQKDNHKVVALLVSKGVNFVTLPDNDEVFILSQALEQKSFKSAFILKEALTAALED